MHGLELRAVAHAALQRLPLWDQSRCLSPHLWAMSPLQIELNLLWAMLCSGALRRDELSWGTVADWLPRVSGGPYYD